ncbi:uncharacterized protein LOC119832860 [Zerene cesonia]|uniref:uncharacterized protein LOC119832860 n=1 Tax=Zerene cesonia TaxID=33412 RepID=UPI0018E51E96|nr:uncharacterized protein LOC119832860 [Zerene cesonia]
MRCEWPELTKCCFCVPLRRGLLAWGYFKLVLNLTLIGFMGLHLYMIITRQDHFPLFGILILASINLVFVTDATFQIIFIVGAHKKNYKYLRCYFRYNVVVLVTVFVCSVIYASYALYSLGVFLFVILFIPFAIQLLLIIILYQLVSFYFLVLSRSEFKKLKNNAKFEFVNQLEEARCTADIASATIA